MYHRMFDWLAHYVREDNKSLPFHRVTDDEFTLGAGDEVITATYHSGDVVFFAARYGTPNGYFRLKPDSDGLLKFFPNEPLGSTLVPPMFHHEAAAYLVKLLANEPATTAA